MCASAQLNVEGKLPGGNYTLFENVINTGLKAAVDVKRRKHREGAPSFLKASDG